MVLNRKGFFLELGDNDSKASETKPKTKPETKAVKVESAPKSPQTAAAPAPVEEIAPVAVAVAVAAEGKSDNKAEITEVEAKPSPTTAEAIAAELAASEAARPEVELVTFAPEALQPGNAIRPGKRRPG